ncbi:uncharacterized protein [Miscanthus floridulus]|uniref:uncharacterized protein n=1 Tax=Miscanthus floridulus TaxID=154761 RepID=UPI003458726D
MAALDHGLVSVVASGKATPFLHTYSSCSQMCSGSSSERKQTLDIRLSQVRDAITTVSLVDGNSTSFWHDVWDGDDSLAERFPELYSHCIKQEISVKQVYEGHFETSLVLRRSAAALDQLRQVNELMGNHTLSQGKNQRKTALSKRNGQLDTSMVYRAIKSANSRPDAWAKFVFFAWLLSQGRIQCRSNLHRKGIVEDSVCEVCNAAEETTAHGCPHAAQFWNALQIPTDQQWPVQARKGIQAPNHIPRKHFSTFLLLCCWHIWKRRNNIVFSHPSCLQIRSLSVGCSTAA